MKGSLGQVMSRLVTSLVSGMERVCSGFVVRQCKEASSFSLLTPLTVGRLHVTGSGVAESLSDLNLHLFILTAF